MQLTYHKSQSTVYPELLDTTSSKTVVYIRKNVTEQLVFDEMTGESHIMYEYDEATPTKSKYEQYLKEQAMKDVLSLTGTVQSQKEQIELLTGCILEMSELVYE